MGGWIALLYCQFLSGAVKTADHNEYDVDLHCAEISV